MSLYSDNAVNYYNFLRGKQMDVTEGAPNQETMKPHEPNAAGPDLREPVAMPEKTTNSAGVYTEAKQG
jgi:hypothetical protein